MNDIHVLMVGMGADDERGWADGLRLAGAHVTVVIDGDTSLQHLVRPEPDAILVNLGLGGVLDGFDTCRAIRAHSEAVLVLVAAAGHSMDEVIALAVGADHFFLVETPVDVVVARVRALVRRARGLVRPGPGNGHGPGIAACTHEPSCGSDAEPRSEVTPRVELSVGAGQLTDGDLEIDLDAREARVGGVIVELTRIEFDLLVTLTNQPRRVFTRQQLLERVWDDPFDGSHVLDTHMSRLRCKVSSAGGGRVGYAIRGVGYRLRG